MATLWENDWDPNALISCPYDPSHRISAKRYQFHIVKCRKNHPNKDFVQCPFNARHVLLRPELRKHIGTCPDKRLLEADIRHQTLCKETGEVEEVILEGRKSPHVEANQEPSSDAEDWDEEAELYMAEKERSRQEKIQRSTTFRRLVKRDALSDSSSESDRSSPGLREIKRTLSCKGYHASLSSYSGSIAKPIVRNTADSPYSCGPPDFADEICATRTDRIFDRIQSANYVPIYPRSSSQQTHMSSS